MTSPYRWDPAMDRLARERDYYRKLWLDVAIWGGLVVAVVLILVCGTLFGPVDVTGGR